VRDKAYPNRPMTVRNGDMICSTMASGKVRMWIWQGLERKRSESLLSLKSKESRKPVANPQADD
jgi:hypothetical protein